MDFIFYYLKLYCFAIIIYFIIFIPREFFGKPVRYRRWTCNYLYAKDISFKKRIFAFLINTGVVFVILFISDIISGNSIVDGLWP